MGRTRKRQSFWQKKGGCRACSTIDELLALAPDYVAEAASVQSVKDCGVKILASGASMIVHCPSERLQIRNFMDR